MDNGYLAIIGIKLLIIYKYFHIGNICGLSDYNY